MLLLKKSYLLSAIKTVAAALRILPLSVPLLAAQALGYAAYYFLPKKSRVVYANLKTVFAASKSPGEIRRMTKKVFANFAQSFIELLYLPKIKRLGFDRFVTVTDWEFIRQSLKRGKGAILLAVHSGNWELASIAGSSYGDPYNIVANEQSKSPFFNTLLNQCRAMAGAKIIAPGTATRDIIRALKKNELVTLVVDQGGKNGSPVKFLGKTASMSTGAIRLGLKYGIPVYPALISRIGLGRHHLKICPLLDMPKDGNMLDVIRQAAEVFEKLILEHPQEYMWFYKVFKYTTEPHVLIIDDGRTGHLRQSQAMARIVGSVLAARGKNAVERTVPVHFKSRWASKIFSLYAFLAQILPFLRREEALGIFLTKASYQDLVKDKADFIISCGSSVGGINFLLSRCHLAKTICLLKPGLVSWNSFDLVIVPSHDDPPVYLKTRLAVTKAALNLINPDYLKDQGSHLLDRYPHLKDNPRVKIGVLLGGDTKGVIFDEGQMRLLLQQIKEMALNLNADILLTTSRRTTPAIDDLVLKELKVFERCPLCVIANECNIPEAVGGIAFLSDLLIVSGESISMVSEAACSGKRVVVFSPVGLYGPNPSSKYERFVLDLNEQGFLVACSIKDVSKAVGDVLDNKTILKVLDDRDIARKAVEEIV